MHFIFCSEKDVVRRIIALIGDCSHLVVTTSDQPDDQAVARMFSRHIVINSWLHMDENLGSDQEIDRYARNAAKLMVMNLPGVSDLIILCSQKELLLAVIGERLPRHRNKLRGLREYSYIQGSQEEGLRGIL